MRVVVSRFKPFLIGLACWVIAMAGHLLHTAGFEVLGVSVVAVVVPLGIYGFRIAYKRVKDDLGTRQ